jgi:LmbE family N-acetylglucosaminyl deacetylase
MKRSAKNRLIIMAHPDDPELACGGTIALWTKHDRVYNVIVTCGEKGTWHKDDAPLRIADKREAEAKKAARYLGVEKVIFLRHPDGEIANLPTLKVELAALIRSIKPHTVVTHDPWRRQFHPDHRATGFAVIDAIMIARDWHFYPFLVEIGLKKYRPKELLLTPTDEPTIVSDITATINKKIRAIKLHNSQLHQLPQWEKRIKQRAQNDGHLAGFKYGEGFHKMRV